MNLALETVRTGPVARLVLNRPDVHNAFDAELIGGLDEAFGALERDPDARVVVIEARGRSFSAGADLGWMRSAATASQEDNRAEALAMGRMFHRLASFPKPLVAAVQGAAMGGGVGLVACADIVIATEKAFFALSEVRLGLVPAVISPFVVAKIGASHARALFLTGERFDADRALRMGLVHQVVPHDQDEAGRCPSLDAALRVTLEALLQGGPEAQRAAKTLVVAVAGRDPADVLSHTAQVIADIRVTPEAREGLGAFMQKRRPTYCHELPIEPVTI